MVDFEKIKYLRVLILSFNNGLKGDLNLAALKDEFDMIAEEFIDLDVKETHKTTIVDSLNKSRAYFNEMNNNISGNTSVIYSKNLNIALLNKSARELSSVLVDLQTELGYQ